MGTIVQEYGPIYGEVVNGTVSGRPNGSVYVPPLNKIELSVTPVDIEYVSSGSDRLRLKTVRPDLTAQAQDLSSYMQTEVYADSDLTTLIAYRTFAAGSFSFGKLTIVGYCVEEGNPLTPGETYYLIARLMNAGNVVASTSVYELEAA